MKKDEDFSTKILYEDSFEDRPLDDAAESSDSPKGILEKFLSMKRWKKVVLCVVTALVVVVAGLTGSFYYLRAQGEKKLKTTVTASADPEDAEEGDEADRQVVSVSGAVPALSGGGASERSRNRIKLRRRKGLLAVLDPGGAAAFVCGAGV